MIENCERVVQFLDFSVSEGNMPAIASLEDLKAAQKDLALSV